MKVLITGATSGIGYSFLKEYHKMNYQVIAVGRNTKRLKEIEEEFNCKVVELDVSVLDNCYKLYQENKEIDILINCAGFGENGLFSNTVLQNEVNMVETNIIATLTLTKLYLKDMILKDKGTILNVGSIASFLPGPLMASYYASKAYVYSLTRSINYELKKTKSNVYVACLCPGPVKTKFFDNANCKSIKPKTSSDYVVRYTLNKMKKRKPKIVPVFSVRLAIRLSRILPYNFIARFVYKVQNSRGKK